MASETNWLVAPPTLHRAVHRELHVLHNAMSAANHKTCCTEWAANVRPSECQANALPVRPVRVFFPEFVNDECCAYTEQHHLLQTYLEWRTTDPEVPGSIPGLDSSSGTEIRSLSRVARGGVRPTINFRCKSLWGAEEATVLRAVEAIVRPTTTQNKTKLKCLILVFNTLYYLTNFELFYVFPQ